MGWVGCRSACVSLLSACALRVAGAAVVVWWQDDDWDDDEDDGGSLYSNPNDNSNPSYDLDDPNANHRQEGIRRDGEGNWQGALESFQAATRHNPTDAGGFNDLGVANMRVALKGIEIEKHLKSARASYELSGEMSGGADENLNRNLVRDPCCLPSCSFCLTRVCCGPRTR